MNEGRVRFIGGPLHGRLLRMSKPFPATWRRATDGGHYQLARGPVEGSRIPETHYRFIRHAARARVLEGLREPTLLERAEVRLERLAARLRGLVSRRGG